jgi:hypothetical protein
MPYRSDHGTSLPLRDHSSLGGRLLFSIWFGLAALCGLMLVDGAAATSGGTLGTFVFTGQVNGTLTVPQVGKGMAGIPLQGCQVGQGSPPTDLLLDGFTAKLRVNGHLVSATSIELDVAVMSTGRVESLAPVGTTSPNGVELTFVVGTKTYQWASVAGSVTARAGAGGGSMTANLAAAGNPGSPQSGGASAPVHVKGSWTSCHPFG